MKFSHIRDRVRLVSVLRRDVASGGPVWLPLVLVLGAIAAVAYADHRVVSISLIYLYILPLSVGALFLRREVSYGLIAGCILIHYFDSPRHVTWGLRIFHNLSALLCFAFVVHIIQRYVAQREILANKIQKQRDDLVKDMRLAEQVQQLFLPIAKPAIAGLEIAGMMRPARGLSGDYYDYSPIDSHRIQVVIADVSGKGVPAALLMSATAAAMQLEATRDRNMIEIVGRLNTGIYSVSDAERYVTLLLAEIDAGEQKMRFINCGHNPALLFRPKTGTITHMNSTCPPIGMFKTESFELDSVDLDDGDFLVFYTDGVTEAEDASGEEFGMERLSTVVRNGFSLTAEQLLAGIFGCAERFAGKNGFNDDVTILVAKCNFNSLSNMRSVVDRT
jgi:serine phosphatase RsbU (regulator of sigma subunit)